MASNKNFNQLSYKKHENIFYNYINGAEKEKHAKTWFYKDTVDAWRHERMYGLLDSILNEYPNTCWLTVGDGRYGKDAHYIRDKGFKVLATDISEALLKEGQEAGYIENYKKENAEALSFADGKFDFVFCKEAYHHFPRPMIGLYEMLRVAEKGIVLIEPNDKYILSTFIEVLFSNLYNLIKRLLNKEIAKHTFEEVGNYVYYISKREIEKACLGMNYRTVAYKGINDVYEEGVEYEKAKRNSKLFRRIRRKIFLVDLLCKLKLRPYNMLCVVIFIEEPDSITKSKLIKEGYEVVALPENPYI